MIQMTKTGTMDVLIMVKDGRLTVEDGIRIIRKVNRRRLNTETNEATCRQVIDTERTKAGWNVYVPKNIF